VNRITVGIDAVNIRAGGGVTHLSNLLSAFDIENSNVGRVIVWTSSGTGKVLPQYEWLDVRSSNWMESNLFFRIFGIFLLLPHLIRRCQCHVIFSPGGILPQVNSVPLVTMSQNMLPFEPDQSLLFGRFNLMRLKMRVLGIVQTRSFKRAHGLVFLTEYARTNVLRVIGSIHAKTTLIPHGIESRFQMPDRRLRRFDDNNFGESIKIVYVSMFMAYKHQKEVIDSVCWLRGAGLPVEIEFIGSSDGAYGKECKALVDKLDPDREFLRIKGHVPFNELHSLFLDADLFLFASSCENLPNILIEGMAARLPIVCSDRGPMPEVLKHAGLYFDPSQPESLSFAIRKLMSDVNLRERLALSAYELSANYSWEKCAKQTFSFLEQVVRDSSKE
jgi:glycosyltransferase involved in cell wall biosynthesis